MLCEICKQNQATIHIQEINNGEKTTLHICESCAVKKGLNAIAGQNINIAEILYKLSASTGGHQIPNAEHIEHFNFNPEDKVNTLIICPKCKWDISKFQKTGRLGCENCYQVFSEILSKTLSSMHRGVFHTGKSPNLKSQGPNLLLLDIINLQKQLDMHVANEEYEEAAKIRDKINKLKKEADSGKK